jgi:hypothetical protein
MNLLRKLWNRISPQRTCFICHSILEQSNDASFKFECLDGEFEYDICDVCASLLEKMEKNKQVKK